MLAVIDKMVKQRRDSITQFEAGKRMDLVAIEQAELASCRATSRSSWPRPRSTRPIAAAIAATGAAGPRAWAR